MTRQNTISFIFPEAILLLSSGYHKLKCLSLYLICFSMFKTTEIDCGGRKSNDAYNENIFYGQNKCKNNTEFNGNHINGNIFKMWLI